MSGYLVSAAPMYDNGTIGDHEETQVALDSDCELAIGSWLTSQADRWIGKWNSDGETHCDAIDVTISKTN